MKSILALTLNPCVDISSHINKILPEEKNRCTRAQYDPGGKSIENLLEELLERVSLEKKLINIRGSTRQNPTFLEDESHEQFRFVMPGPTLMESEWQECLDYIFGLVSMPSYIVVSGSFPFGVATTFISQLVRQLKDIQTRLFIDTSKEALQQATKEKVYLLKTNLREFTQLLNRNLIDDHELEASCKEFMEKEYYKVLILSLGGKGAFLATSNEVKRIVAPKVISKSNIGAGDSVVGVIIFGLVNDYNLFDSAILGIAAGTAAVSTEGTELCRENDVWKIYTEMKRKSDEN